MKKPTCSACWKRIKKESLLANIEQMKCNITMLHLPHWGLLQVMLLTALKTAFQLHLFSKNYMENTLQVKGNNMIDIKRLDWMNNRVFTRWKVGYRSFLFPCWLWHGKNRILCPFHQSHCYLLTNVMSVVWNSHDTRSKKTQSLIQGTLNLQLQISFLKNNNH